MRRRRLGGITSPSPVEVRGRIASPDAVTSPITGARAAIIGFYVFVPARLERRAGREAHDRLVDGGIWGEPFTVATDDGLLFVPLENVTPYFSGANADEHPLLEPLPDPLAYLRTVARVTLAEGSLYYRELALRGGDQVRVRGTAGPAEGCGAYRVSASIPFVLRGDLEPATVAFDVPEFA
jgi:hypothetical protein